MKAVRFDEYGDVDVLKVVDVPKPVPGPGQVLVQVKAAGINPGEAKIRAGLLHARWPATFPSGQGSDLAGIVAETGPGVTGVRRRGRGHRLHRQPGQPGRVRRGRGAEPDRQARGRAVGGRRGAVRGRGDGLCRRPGRRPDRGRHRGGLRGGRRGRLARRPAGQARRRHRDRPGGPGQPRVAGRARSDTGGLRRRGGRPDPAGGRQGRRVHRHVRRGLRAAGPGARRRAFPDRHHRQLRGGGRSTESRPRAARPGPARACWPSWPG